MIYTLIYHTANKDGETENSITFQGSLIDVSVMIYELPDISKVYIGNEYRKDKMFLGLSNALKSMSLQDLVFYLAHKGA